jgi:hypothetical protein
MLSASEAWPGACVQDVNGWTVFFLLVAWESRDQAKRGLSGAPPPARQRRQSWVRDHLLDRRHGHSKRCRLAAHAGVGNR